MKWVARIGFFFLMCLPAAQAREFIAADGPGGADTYALLRRAFTVEVPDCGHAVPHITEVFDDQLGKNVFVFHAHVKEDNDRCRATDRQRTEIRGRAPGMLAGDGNTLYYRWKFRLPPGFLTSFQFTHIFQIKSELDPPIMTLTPRGREISIDGRIGERGTASLAGFIGNWVVVDLMVRFANAGRVQMTIRRFPGGEMLFSHAGDADTWDDNANLHDPKFGIYRSLGSPDRLRDEQVRFADFCVSRVNATECLDDSAPPPASGGATPATDAGPPPPSRPGSNGGESPPAGTSPPDMPMPPSAPSGPGVAPTPSSGSPLPAADPGPAPDLQGGCGCNIGSAGESPTGTLAVVALLLGAATIARRRRRSARQHTSSR